MTKAKTHNKNRWGSLLAGALLCCGTTNLFAQNLALEEIVVTAQKREQNLQDVAISVSVLSADYLEVRNENEISSLAKLSPGFTFSSGPSNATNSIQIRGIGSQAFSRGIDQSVSTVIDGVVATSLSIAQLDLSDIEQVEVLRGPQGMLFGKNASAGVLNIVTKGPTEEFETMLGGSYGAEDEIKVNGYVSGPLGDSMAARLSFYSNSRDAYLENEFPGGADANDREDWGIRGKLAFNPSDNLDILVTVNHLERDYDFCCELVAQGLVPGSVAETLGVPAGPKNDKILENGGNTGSSELTNVILDVNYQMGNFSLTSITSYVDSEVSSISGSENLPVTSIVELAEHEDINQFTQELRLASPPGETLEYMIGLYYFYKDTDLNVSEAVDPFPLGFTPVPGILVSTATYDPKVENESYALFSNVTLNVNERTRLTAGFRLNHEELDMDFSLVTPTPGRFTEFPIVIPLPDFLFLGPTSLAYSVSDSDTSVLWRFIGEYDVADDAMIYASASRGYKGIGVDTGSRAHRFITAGASPLVEPEIPTNFELGIKSRWLDNRLGVNATLFYTQFEDFQAESSTASLGGPPAIFLDNAEELETYGLELEVHAQVFENFRLSGSLAYIEAEFVDYTDTQCYAFQPDGPNECVGRIPGLGGGFQDLSGKDVPNSPDISFNIDALYEKDFQSLPFRGFANVSYYWQDDTQSQTNNNPATIMDSYGIANLSVGVTSDDDRYSIRLWVKNLFDEYYVTTARDFSAQGLGGGQTVIQYLPYDYERRIGVAGSIRF